MAEEQGSEKTGANERFLQPVVVFFKTLWMLIDVATLMVRLLLNTLLYDSPHGKVEASEIGTGASKAS